ncbi:MAG TPA: hypothetical protein VJ276_09385 [Thermoanaerobaculia bacterium]|nr:hypothetical protein [Thermoanaerobaculia bacterium]
MKRVLLALFLLAAPLMALAQSQDRDDLLTPAGTLFTIESAASYEYPKANATSTRLLALTVQRQNQQSSTVFVPESLQSGSHTSPALAYDSDSDTLFVFWERGLNNHITSNLLFASYQNGKWSAATSIESADFHWCHNLRIGVTRKMEQDVDGVKTMVPGLNVHAVWWDYNPHGEQARYAMLTIEKGGVVNPEIQKRDLSQFFTARDLMPTAAYDPNADDEVLRHPQLFESADHDSVDVVFGDIASATFRRLTLRTQSDGRIRIPLGVRGGTVGTPKLKADPNAKVSAVGVPGKMALYTVDGDVMRYVMLSGETWSPARAIALNGKVSEGSAVDVIRRMVSSE